LGASSSLQGTPNHAGHAHRFRRSSLGIHSIITERIQNCPKQVELAAY
jgi:hypothetical protein